MIPSIPRSRWRMLPFALLVLIVFSLFARPTSTTSRAGEQPWPAAYLALVTNGGAQLPPPTTAPTRTATATPTVTALPTATATPAATSTAFPTSTVPPADTRSCKGVYPIAISAQLLDIDAEAFAPPSNPEELPYYIPYRDETYQNTWQRRVFMTPGMPAYGYVRWLSSVPSSSVLALSEAMTGTGTLDAGFEEVVPWPDASQSAPEDYPVLPGQLNEGDWMYGFDSIRPNAALYAAFDNHIQQRTVMILPTISKTIEAGGNHYFHMLRYGNFLLRGYGPDYLDLVYISMPDPPPCTP